MHTVLEEKGATLLGCIEGNVLKLNCFLSIPQICLCSAVSCCLELTRQICVSIVRGVKWVCKWGLGHLELHPQWAACWSLGLPGLCSLGKVKMGKQNAMMTKQGSLFYLICTARLWRQRWNRWDNKSRCEFIRGRGRTRDGERIMPILQFSITGYFCVTGKADLGLRPEEFDRTLSLYN